MTITTEQLLTILDEEESRLIRARHLSSDHIESAVLSALIQYTSNLMDAIKTLDHD